VGSTPTVVTPGAHSFPPQPRRRADCPEAFRANLANFPLRAPGRISKMTSGKHGHVMRSAAV
jgi:hypothetical protein